MRLLPRLTEGHERMRLPGIAEDGLALRPLDLFVNAEGRACPAPTTGEAWSGPPQDRAAVMHAWKKGNRKW